MASKRNSVVFFSVAVVLGLVAAFLAQQWAQQRVVDAEAQAARHMTSIVVASTEIGFGQRIEDSNIKLVEWPESAQPEGSFKATETVVGMVSKYHILPGEPVMQARVADPKNGPLLAGLIEPNKRAVSVRVDDVVGVGGFLLPGSRVDVVATRQLDNKRNYKTKTILHNLKVLAVDQTASAGGEDKPVVVRAVTLEVNPAEAESLVQATREGSVQLALRNPEDQSKPPVAMVNPKPKPRVVKRTSTSSKVTVIRGTNVNTQQHSR